MSFHALIARQSGQPGENRDQPESSSLSAFISTLIPTLALAVLYLVIFAIARKSYVQLYRPRTYNHALRKDQRTPTSKWSFFSWITDVTKTQDLFILNHQSLDSYLYVRWFKIMGVMCVVGMCITWPVLFPVNATGGGGRQQLDILNFGNVVNANRFWAHAGCAWLFVGFVLFLITRETVYFINLRQAYLLTPWNSSRISSRTVLFTSVPESYLDEAKLRAIFPLIKNIWFATDCKKLEEKVGDLDKAVFKLEGAETTLITKGKDRPTHRLKPLIGHKVDTIDWSCQQISELVPVIETDVQSRITGDVKKQPAVFIEFDSQIAAQAAFGMVTHHVAKQMEPRQWGISPDDIIWSNLSMPSYQRTVRYIIVTAAICALIIFWAIPVALVGIISNVNYLTENVAFLRWINDIPDVILGVVTGLLPVVLLAVLMSLVPVICRLLSKIAGAVTLSEVELQTQNWYFAFQVIQVFLVTTFTSGATAVASQIVSKPASAIPLLAENLPAASNFYISYFILYGVANSTGYLLQIVSLALSVVLYPFLDKTPRKKFNRYLIMPSIAWGSSYPVFTNFGVIIISYSCIAPLVLGFAAIGFGTLYFAYRYNFLYVYDAKIDTKGAAYAQALQHLFVGLYIFELCLIGLLAIKASDQPSGSGPLVVVIILLVGTVLYHISMRSTFSALKSSLPRTLLFESAEEYPVSTTSDLERGHGGPSTDSGPVNSGPINGEDSTADGLPIVVKEATPPATGAITPASIGAHPTHINHLAAGPLPPTGLKGRIHSFFFPKSISSASIAATLDPLFQSPVPAYPAHLARTAFYHPAINHGRPVVWIPRDANGVSDQEVEKCQAKVGEWAEVTNRGAWVDAKGKVQWGTLEDKEGNAWDDVEGKQVRAMPVWGEEKEVVW
ncbi:phosphate metabolism protein 7 [Eremomyces bilateralis CBS 781.70]|uniref:Phosphate metabolism protein 7 n=1 Tax=Eremomyces bilateralis CBS 781.70 TaxID=1392243 RepID=A0A6G1G833_9PEZI|nr:phosphate metabolism protein 7 [Eremomyces bilateralis CBS 781.70]KAF1814265.1 phosphate metabolism protein 7 [Eremomyces bilateralis CBS 781.70]